MAGAAETERAHFEPGRSQLAPRERRAHAAAVMPRPVLRARDFQANTHHDRETQRRHQHREVDGAGVGTPAHDGGITAPPTMAMTRNDEPDLVYVAEAAQAHGEDGRELDGHEEAGGHQRVQPDIAAGHRGDHAQRHVTAANICSNMAGRNLDISNVPMKRPGEEQRERDEQVVRPRTFPRCPEY